MHALLTSRKTKVVGFLGTVALTGGLVASAVAGTGAYFSDTKANNHITGTMGSIQIQGHDGSGANNLDSVFTNMLPGQSQSTTLRYSNTGANDEDVWIVFNNPTKLHALNQLGTYGEVHVASNGGEKFASQNLNDGYACGTAGNRRRSGPLRTAQQDQARRRAAAGSHRGLLVLVQAEREVQERPGRAAARPRLRPRGDTGRRPAGRLMRGAKVAARLLLAVVVLTLAAGGVVAAVAHHQGYRAFVVRTGSMTPDLPPGDLLIDAPPTGPYRQGDVITFKVQAAPGLEPVVTHRVYGVHGDKIKTKGDANLTPDPGTRTDADVVGEVVRQIPHAGYLLVFLRQPGGLHGNAHRVGRADVLLVDVLRCLLRRRATPPTRPATRVAGYRLTRRIRRAEAHCNYGDPIETPAFYTSFVGRRSLLADVRSAPGVVPGRHAGRARRGREDPGRPPDQPMWSGVATATDAGWCRSAQLAEPDLLSPAVAEALGLHGADGPWQVDTLADYVAERTALLVLDNCEHLLAAVSDLVQGLRASLPERPVPAHQQTAAQAERRGRHRRTPAQPSRRGDRRPRPRPSPTTRPSTCSWTARSRRRSDFQLTPDNAPVVSALCRDLDGTPAGHRAGGCPDPGTVTAGDPAEPR